MAENKMKEVAKLLGVELGQEFEIKGAVCNPYHFSITGLVDKLGCYSNNCLTNLLNGDMEIQKPILTDKEKHYLQNVLRPFKDDVLYIVKYENYSCKKHWIDIIYKDDLQSEDFLSFPSFKKDTMYKGMVLDKKYSLKELGLFEED